jgi:hypothetical protein
MKPGRKKGTPKTGGRQKGTRNKRTAALLQHVEATGVTPLDYLLHVMRDPKMPRAMRFEAARVAAPYVHPRLQAVEHSGKAGGAPIVIGQPEISDEDRAKALAVFLKRHQLRQEGKIPHVLPDAQREGGAS